MTKIENYKNQTIENTEINENFEELEITNSTLNKADFQNTTFNYLEINNSKIKIVFLQI